MNKRVELLSPAGNIDGFYGAMKAGADAVYLAGNRFGARAYAENFTEEQLIECITYAHLFKKKVYLTVNTLIKDKEINEIYDYLAPLYLAGLDAVIVQDMGVVRILRESFPDMEIHASTQMTICSRFGAELLKEMGATRIVPARELSLRELIEIKNSVDIELETFIHGAMCYCYSGQCLFSSILGGRSGNRGRCAQPCRLPYSVPSKKGGKEQYLLSLKDMCTIEHIPQLIEAGIDSFKIEGRMKKPEYTAAVTSLYRKYIELYYRLREQFSVDEAAKKYQVDKKDFIFLNSVYTRSDIQDGYYFKHNGKEMVTLHDPAYNACKEDDLIKIQAAYLKDKHKLPIKIKAFFIENEMARIECSYHDITCTVEGEIVSLALKQPITKENIEKQLNKLGETSFQAEQISVHVSQNAFYSLKEINTLRREAISKLSGLILVNNNYLTRELSAHNSSNKESKYSLKNTLENDLKALKYDFSVFVRTAEQLEGLSKWLKTNDEYKLLIYIDIDLYQKNNEIDTFIMNHISNTYMLALPYIIRHKDIDFLQAVINKANKDSNIKGFLIRSLDGLSFIKGNRVDNKLIHGDANLYVWNNQARMELQNFLSQICIPYELKNGEQFFLKNIDFPVEKIVYSHIPMMITANCIQKTIDECNPGNNNILKLKDRYGKEFPVIRNCKHCYNIIYNCIPFSLHNEEIYSGFLKRIDLTIEQGEDVIHIMNCFTHKESTLNEYTTGHEKRGVE